MQRRGRVRPMVIGRFLGGLTAAALAVTACGVAQSDYDAVQQRLATKEQQVTQLQQQVSAASAASAAQSAVTTLIGARVVPTPTAAPPPTPLPAGAPAPERPAPPASLYEPVSFAFYVETLATTSIGKDAVASTVACTPNSVFKRGMKIVWRFEVFDTSTDRRLTDRDDATVKVRLPNNEELTARFSQRGGGSVPTAPWTWNAAWDIPMNHPLGSFDYTINVTSKDGRSGTFQQPYLARGADLDSRLKIIG